MPQLERYVRKAANISKFTQAPSARAPQHARFNPDSVLHTKAQTGEAMKWWHHQRLALPNIPPKDWKAPKPRGKAAWPASWDDSHAKMILSIKPDDVRSYSLTVLQKIVHEEVQRDGYDLREVDFEGKPVTELPDIDLIANFVLEEQTIRDRVLRRALDEHFRIPVTAIERKNIRSVETLICYIESVMQTYREPENFEVPPKVKAFTENYPVKPRFGFQFALPQSTRSDIEQAWEKLFIHDWQFGKAVYTPKSRENTRGNMTWLRLSKEWEDRRRHHKAYPECGNV